MSSYFDGRAQEIARRLQRCASFQTRKGRFAGSVRWMMDWPGRRSAARHR